MTNCGKCLHKDSCKEVYAKLGEYKGPSVVWKIILVFLVPLFSFIVFLIAAEKLIKPLIGSELIGSLLSFSAAIVFTFLIIVITSFLVRKFY